MCTLVAADVRDGRERWRLAGATGNVGEDTIGRRGPFAPRAGARLLLTGAASGGLTLLDPATGAVSAARVPSGEVWFALAAGDLIVTIDHDPAGGDRDCTVAVTAYTGATGARAWPDIGWSCSASRGEKFRVGNRSGAAGLRRWSLRHTEATHTGGHG